MAKKQYFAIVDTETTVDNTVADFACIIVDRDGKIHNQCAVIIGEQFDNSELFYIAGSKSDWSLDYAKQKRAGYNQMIQSGHRMIASVAAINTWIAKAIGKYDPVLTAYNLAFDADKCANTGIDLTGFSNRFCLWQAAVGNICNSKKYRQFALDNHAFNRVTEHGNMTFKTNAEIVCGFVTGDFKSEPHTALEDARDFELPILQKIVNRKNWRDNIVPYNWKNFQVKDNFTAK
jgi:hypothetical protein